MGHHNKNAGPDFTDVHLLIDGIELIGEVEIHMDSRSWYEHHHDTDPSYNHILLHVVRHASQPVYNTLGQLLPQMELQYNSEQDYIDEMLNDALAMDSAMVVHYCSERLMADPNLITQGWKETMLNQRLNWRCESIERLLRITHNDWRQVFYICLARAFGFHINSVPMELLALSTPLNVLAKYRNHLPQLSALLLGQAGLLGKDDSLLKEYQYLSHKHELVPIDATLWRMGRLRPHNQPRVRILQMAQLIHLSECLLSKCFDTLDIKKLQQLFIPTQMGLNSINSLLINVVVPFVYARGQRQKALQLLRQMPSENNRIIRQWEMVGQQVTSAADSQALLHLFQTYCESKQCFRCEVWNEN